VSGLETCFDSVLSTIDNSTIECICFPRSLSTHVSNFYSFMSVVSLHPHSFCFVSSISQKALNVTKPSPSSASVSLVMTTSAVAPTKKT
jgi:hypothetical protein